MTYISGRIGTAPRLTASEKRITPIIDAFGSPCAATIHEDRVGAFIRDAVKAERSGAGHAPVVCNNRPSDMRAKFYAVMSDGRWRTINDMARDTGGSVRSMRYMVISEKDVLETEVVGTVMIYRIKARAEVAEQMKQEQEKSNGYK